MIGILAVIWGLLLLWSLGGSIPGINWVMPGTPPPLRYTFWAGVGVFVAYFLWPWIRGLGRGATPTTAPTAAGPGAVVRPGLTWGQWFVVTFIVSPLLVPAFLLALHIGWPELFNFIWVNNVVLGVAIVLTAIIFGLTPPHNPDFLKGITKWFFIVILVMVGIRYGAYKLMGGTYYHGTLYDGKLVFRPHPGPVGEEGDTVRVNGVKGGYSFRKTLLNPNANPDSFTFIGVEGDPVLTRKFHLGLPDEPVGKLIYKFDGGRSFASFSLKKTAEIKISERGPIEFFFNEEDKILNDPYTEGEVWLIVYINPQLTPGGWFETAIKTQKYQLGTIAFFVVLVILLGLAWWKVPTPAGKKAAAIFILIVFSMIGWKAWEIADRQVKEEFRKSAPESIEAQKKMRDPFLPPAARRAVKPPLPPESAFDKAERTVNVGSDLFTVIFVFLVAGGVFVGAKKLLL